MGCYERTLAWLIEKYAGMFPTWLCPEQVRVIPVSYTHLDVYKRQVNLCCKKGSFIPTCTCTNLHNNVLVIIRIFRKKKDLKFMLQFLYILDVYKRQG